MQSDYNSYDSRSSSSSSSSSYCGGRNTAVERNKSSLYNPNYKFSVKPRTLNSMLSKLNPKKADKLPSVSDFIYFLYDVFKIETCGKIIENAILRYQGSLCSDNYYELEESIHTIASVTTNTEVPEFQTICNIMRIYFTKNWLKTSNENEYDFVPDEYIISYIIGSNYYDLYQNTIKILRACPCYTDRSNVLRQFESTLNKLGFDKEMCTQLGNNISKMVTILLSAKSSLEPGEIVDENSLHIALAYETKTTKKQAEEKINRNLDYNEEFSNLNTPIVQKFLQKKAAVINEINHIKSNNILVDVKTFKMYLRFLGVPYNKVLSIFESFKNDFLNQNLNPMLYTSELPITNYTRENLNSFLATTYKSLNSFIQYYGTSTNNVPDKNFLLLFLQYLPNIDNADANNVVEKASSLALISDQGALNIHDVYNYIYRKIYQSFGSSSVSNPVLNHICAILCKYSELSPESFVVSDDDIKCILENEEGFNMYQNTVKIARGCRGKNRYKNIQVVLENLRSNLYDLRVDTKIRAKLIRNIEKMFKVKIPSIEELVDHELVEDLYNEDSLAKVIAYELNITEMQAKDEIDRNIYFNENFSDASTPIVQKFLQKKEYCAYMIGRIINGETLLLSVNTFSMCLRFIGVPYERVDYLFNIFKQDILKKRLGFKQYIPYLYLDNDAYVKLDSFLTKTYECLKFFIAHYGSKSDDVPNKNTLLTLLQYFPDIDNAKAEDLVKMACECDLTSSPGANKLWNEIYKIFEKFPDPFYIIDQVYIMLVKYSLGY